MSSLTAHIQTGHITYLPRLERCIISLQQRVKPTLSQHTHLPCDIHYTIPINFFTKLLFTTMLDLHDEEDGEFYIKEMVYAIEICESHTILAIEKTGNELEDPSIIAQNLVKQMEKYDLYHLSFCKHCGKDLLERGRDACTSCEIAKITWVEMCAICYDDNYFCEPSVWAQLECRHVFHRSCILQIRQHVHNRIKCPLCRNEQDPWSAII